MGLFDNATEIECFKQDLGPGLASRLRIATGDRASHGTAQGDRTGSISSHGDSGRFSYVSRHDQLRLAGMDFGPDGLPL